jgi:two-component system, NarL family, response regulator DegU
MAGRRGEKVIKRLSLPAWQPPPSETDLRRLYVIRMVVADRHRLFREGVKQILSQMDRPISFVDCGDGETVLKACRENVPDLVLMDLDLSKGSGVDITIRLKEEYPQLPIILLSGERETTTVVEAVRAGASGYLPKDVEAEDLMEAVRLVLAGEIYIHPRASGQLVQEILRISRQQRELTAIVPEFDVPEWPNILTQREMDVLRLMAQGKNNRAIGDVLYISEKTVKNHVSNILYKLGVQDRTQAVLVALKKGWVKLH